MAGVIEFTPVRLVQARTKVQEVHRGTADEPPAPDQSGLEELRRRVLDAGMDEHRLERLADSLSPREVRMAVPGLEQWEELREQCLTILRRRATARLVPSLWNAWQRHPIMDELRALLLEFGGVHGWSPAVPALYANAVSIWVEKPGRGLQQWLDQEGLSASDLPELAGRPVRGDSPLARLTREFVLTHGSLAQLRRDHRHLIEWQAELDPEKAILFGRNYLASLPAQEWTRELIDALNRRYGTPKKPKVERFWEPLSSDVKAAFQKLFIRHRIREELGHDHDRARFWTRWDDELVYLAKGMAGNVRYAELEFPNFVVFEFFETGNAAYFYLPADAAPLRKKSAATTGDLKKRISYPFLRWQENRLIHNPPERWWPKGDRMVSRWLAKAGRSK
jgi:hypothetical protein